MINFRNSIRLAVIALFFVFIASCSHSSNPVTPEGGDRILQDFGPPNLIFGLAGASPATIDMAALGAYSLSESGRPIAINGDYWTVAVSLQHTPQGDFPFYAWLQDEETTPVVERIIAIPGPASRQFAFPKVDALYVENEIAGWEVYVAVTYMWRDTGDDWNIGLWIAKWDQYTFPAGEPTIQNSTLLNESDDQSFPDLAFDFDSTGSLFVTYTSYYSELQYAPYPNQLVYRQYTRSGSTWSGTNARLVTRDPASGYLHNCWLPRIDVGYLDSPPGYPGQFEPFVAVAYTQEGWPNVPQFTCAITYWPAGEEGGIFNDWPLVNDTQGYENFTAGLPDIDISPNDSSSGYYGAIAFVQEVPPLTYPWRYEVWVLSYKPNEEPPWDFFEVENDDYPYRANILPSIAIHYENIGPHYASVTMLESKNDWAPGNVYRPFATIVNLDDGSQLNAHWVQITADIDGPWVPLQCMAVTDPGPRTDIVMLPGGGDPLYNNYFAGYCDGVDGTPNAVYIAWGNAADYF